MAAAPTTAPATTELNRTGPDIPSAPDIHGALSKGSAPQRFFKRALKWTIAFRPVARAGLIESESGAGWRSDSFQR